MSFDGLPHVSSPYVEDPLVRTDGQGAVARLLARALNEAYVYADEHARLLAAAYFALGEREVFNATPQTVLAVEGIVVPPHARRIVGYEFGRIVGEGVITRRLTLIGSPNLVADAVDESNSGEWSVAIDDLAVDRTDLSIFLQVAATTREATGPLVYGVRGVSLWWAP